jgi:hypothetical protein
LDFAAVYSDSTREAAKRTLRDVWRSHYAEWAKVTEDSSANPKAYHDYVIKVVETEGLAEPLALFVDYFDNVTVCIEQKICETETTKALLQRDAIRIFNLHREYIMDMRSRDATFAMGWEKFAFK